MTLAIHIGNLPCLTLRLGVRYASLMLKTPSLSIIYTALAAILVAVGQFLYRSAIDNTTDGPLSPLVNPRTIADIGRDIAVMVLFVLTCRNDGTVTMLYLYPICALMFIWAALIAQVVHNHPIQTVRIWGMTLLVTGLSLKGL